MKVFLSWFGELSHKIAVILRDWLPSVIQAVNPYVSSEDIDKGARWSVDIAKELEASGFGILCVTPDSMDAPWLNFEAGALSKALDRSRVSPFLVGVRPSELRGPLVQFQATIVETADVWKLLQSVNRQLADGQLDESLLRRSFDRWWPDLEKNITEAQRAGTTSKAKSPRRDSAETLEEVLELVRTQHRMLSVLPEQLLYARRASVGVPLGMQPRITLWANADGTYLVTLPPTLAQVPSKQRFDFPNKEEVAAFLLTQQLSEAAVSHALSTMEPQSSTIFEVTPQGGTTMFTTKQRRPPSQSAGAAKSPQEPRTPRVPKPTQVALDPGGAE